MSELVMEEKRESLCYGMEEETSCAPCEGGKREALSLERRKRPVVEEEEEEEEERERESIGFGKEEKTSCGVEIESFGKEEESDFRERNREMCFFG